MHMILGIFIFFLGLVQTLAPDFIYEITEGLKNRNAEPTDAYLVFMRVAGVFMMILAGYLITGKVKIG